MATGDKKSWFDPKISWQTVIAAVLAASSAAGCVNSSYSSAVERITKLEQHDASQDQHFQQIEKTIDQQRGDMKEQLGTIAGDVKDIRKYLMDRQQPAALGRWTK